MSKEFVVHTMTLRHFINFISLDPRNDRLHVGYLYNNLVNVCENSVRIRSEG